MTPSGRQGFIRHRIHAPFQSSTSLVSPQGMSAVDPEDEQGRSVRCHTITFAHVVAWRVRYNGDHPLPRFSLLKQLPSQLRFHRSHRRGGTLPQRVRQCPWSGSKPSGYRFVAIADNLKIHPLHFHRKDKGQLFFFAFFANQN